MLASAYWLVAYLFFKNKKTHAKFHWIRHTGRNLGILNISMDIVLCITNYYSPT